MIVFPNCKINLGLYITGKRADGYHDIETIFFPVPLYDLLEIIPAHGQTGCQLHQTGLSIEAAPDNNLCVKAYQLLKKDFSSLPAITTYLHKQIPAGAGLGGGSADGAFMLQLLATRFQLPLNKEQLKQYALQLGSDCPFFIENKPMLATGRGEHMRPVSPLLKGWHLVLILPGLHVSTQEAFMGCTPKPLADPIESIIEQPVTTWRDKLINQFEETVFLKHPRLAHIKQLLYDQGAAYASMSGTGSTVYGLFSKQPDKAIIGEQSGGEVRILLL
jgi:4-diphosphocytidyl-2-C-methyl-D-erythritol kinase